jgi:disulfide oxidoreductase YuzD
VAYRYLDAADPALDALPDKVRAMARDPLLLPLSVVDGEVVFTGAFSPSRIDYEIRRRLATRWTGDQARPDPPVAQARGLGG